MISLLNFLSETVIIIYFFHLTKGDRLPDGRTIPLTPGRIPFGARLSNVSSYSGDWARANFCSPSIEYASWYSQYSTQTTNESGQAIWPIIVLMLRVNPIGMEIHRQTIYKWDYQPRIDSNFQNNELEWRIVENSNVKVYGILLKEMTEDPVQYWRRRRTNSTSS